MRQTDLIIIRLQIADGHRIGREAMLQLQLQLPLRRQLRTRTYNSVRRNLGSKEAAHLRLHYLTVIHLLHCHRTEGGVASPLVERPD